MVLSMDRWRGKVAIVTGAACGIGRAIVEQLVEAGLKVVGADILTAELEDVSKQLQNKNGKFYSRIVDMTKEEEILKLFKWTTDEVGPVHILVNSAGVLQPTTLTDGDTAMWKKVFDINVLGLCIATREAVKIMKEHKIDGHIVHICSIGGHAVAPYHGLNVYPASKFAVRALTETLRQEFNHLGLKIKVTEVCPSTTSTSLRKNCNFSFDEKTLQQMAGKIKKPLEPSDIADSVLYALSTAPHVQVHDIVVHPIGDPHP